MGTKYKLLSSPLKFRTGQRDWHRNQIGEDQNVSSTPSAAGCGGAASAAVVNSAPPDLRCRPNRNRRKHPRPLSSGLESRGDSSSLQEAPVSTHGPSFQGHPPALSLVPCVAPCPWADREASSPNGNRERRHWHSSWDVMFTK